MDNSRPTRVLVTGATGHLGAYVCREWLARGAQVAALVRPSSNRWRLAEVANALHFITGDLTELADCAEAIRAFAPTVTVHLAWDGAASGRYEDAVHLQPNVDGTLRLLKTVHAAGCTHFIGLGTAFEHGKTNRLLTADTPAQPDTAYAVGKYCAGLLTAKYCALVGMRHTWLRLLALYGPMDTPRRLFPTLATTLLTGERPRLTTCDANWDYLYVTDAANAVCQVATHGVTGVYPLASGTPIHLREAAECLRDLIDPTLAIGFGEVPLAANPLTFFAADVTPLCQAAHWEPQVGYAEGLAMTVAWYRAHCASLKERV